MKTCIYCRASKATTGDHIPPKFISKGILGNKEHFIKVPCCLQCNQEFSKSEEKCVDFFKQLYSDKSVTIEFIRSELSNNDALKEVLKKTAIGYRYCFTGRIIDSGNEVEDIECQLMDESSFLRFKSKFKYEENISPELYPRKEPMRILIKECKDIAAQNKEYTLFTPEILRNYFWFYYDEPLNRVYFSIYSKLLVTVTFKQ